MSHHCTRWVVSVVQLHNLGSTLTGQVVQGPISHQVGWQSLHTSFGGRGEWHKIPSRALVAAHVHTETILGGLCVGHSSFENTLHPSPCVTCVLGLNDRLPLNEEGRFETYVLGCR